MARCHNLNCRGYLIYEREFLDSPAQLRCVACEWTVCDPTFRREEPRYFPSEAEDKKIGWRQEHPCYDLYYPSSAACQLGISTSFFRYSVKRDPSAPVIVGRGVIACNTETLQRWWDGKKHHA